MHRRWHGAVSFTIHHAAPDKDATVPAHRSPRSYIDRRDNRFERLAGTLDDAPRARIAQSLLSFLDELVTEELGRYERTKLLFDEHSIVAQPAIFGHREGSKRVVPELRTDDSTEDAL